MPTFRNKSKKPRAQNDELAAIKAEFDRISGDKSGDGSGFDKLTLGKNARRFHKSPKDLTFYASAAMHGGVGDGVSVYAVRCADDKNLTEKELLKAGYIVKGKRIACRVCAKARELVAASNKRFPRGSAEGREAFKEIMQSFGVRERYLSWVSHVEDGVVGDPMPLEYGVQVHRELLQMYLSPEFCGDFVSPKHGYVMFIVRQGEGKNDTKYTVKQGKRLRTSVLSDLPSIRTKAKDRWPLLPPAQIDEYLAMPKEEAEEVHSSKPKKKSKKDKQRDKNKHEYSSSDKLRAKVKNPYSRR